MIPQKQNYQILNFNRGLISSRGIARLDYERAVLSASVYTNWMPRVLGPMSLRPGFGYIGATASNNKAFHIPFIFANDDTAIIEITDQVMRVRVSETIITRPSVSSAVTNGNFDTDVASWTDADETGCTSAWATGGYLSLIGTNYSSAIRRQQVTVGVSDQNVEHALRIVIERGPVYLKVGSSAGGEQYIAETALGAGTHSIAFTPTGDFHIELAGRELAASLVASCNVESAGAMTIPVDWVEADLGNLRSSQSGDVVYMACRDYKPFKIERRTTRSWSVVKYQTEDGPFRAPNTGSTRITPSGLTGDITLTASRALFASTNVGSLYRMTSVGQNVIITISGDGQWSDPIRVTGVGSSQRSFTITRASLAGNATATLQRSVGEVGSWIDVTTYTTDATSSYNDGLDNQIVYYRIGVDTGDYVAGAPVLSLSYASGGLTGIVRITGYTSATSVSAAVLSPLGATTATENWEEGEWSDRRGYPSAVVLYEGRLIWGGKGRIWASISDEYDSFNDEEEGDAAPFSRNIPSGATDHVNWFLPLKRLMIGTDSAEWTLMSSSLDEILTATNANLKEPTNQGSANVQSVKVDSIGMFVQKSGIRIMQTNYAVEKDDFQTDDVTKLCPEFFSSGIERLAVQRQPDTRVHAVQTDGTVMILVFDALENIKAWVKVETDGDVEDVFTLPGTDEDYVYYCVKRTIDGSTVRYLEKWAYESECVGGSVNKQADSFITYSGASTVTMTGLDHLEGEAVVVWQNGVCPEDASGDVKTYTVASGSITLDTATTSAVIGLPYTAQWKSFKLASVNRRGTSLTMNQIVNSIGILAENMHYKGVQYGPDFDNLDDLPGVEQGTTVTADTVHATYDEDMFEFDGTWNPDCRVCLQAQAPRPATLNALIVGLKISEKNDRL